jgi:S-adenosyl methyltransferase
MTRPSRFKILSALVTVAVATWYSVESCMIVGSRDPGARSPDSIWARSNAASCWLVAVLARELAPGSYLAISHLTSDFAPAAVTAAVGAYNTLVPTALIPRTHNQVSALFAGLPLVSPGVVPVAEWRPVIADQFPLTADLYAGVARTSGNPPR